MYCNAIPRKHSLCTVACISRLYCYALVRSEIFVVPIAFLKIYLFIFGCVGSSLLHVGFLQLWRAGATLHCGAQASNCGGFSLLQSTGSRRTGFSSCGSWVQLLRGMWDLPGPGIESMFPALAGRFLTTVPSSKSLSIVPI